MWPLCRAGAPAAIEPGRKRLRTCHHPGCPASTERVRVLRTMTPGAASTERNQPLQQVNPAFPGLPWMTRSPDLVPLCAQSGLWVPDDLSDVGDGIPFFHGGYRADVEDNAGRRRMGFKNDVAEIIRHVADLHALFHVRPAHGQRIKDSSLFAGDGVDFTEPHRMFDHW